MAPLSSDMPAVTIYTDGSCLGNPGPGGWAAVLQFGEHEKALTGAASHTTNNRMEIRAAINALQALTKPCRVDLHTDSEYLRNGISGWLQNWVRNGWRTATKKPVKNKDLWKQLLPLVERHEVRWHWVKGHTGHPLNERVDQLSREAAIRDAKGAPADMEASAPRLTP